MAQSYDYDAIVIGAGIAGMVSAVTANGLGKRVAVTEKRKVGGNCTNFTCIPSKTLIRLSHTNREISRLVSLGLLSGDATAVDGRNVMAHIRSVVKKAYGSCICLEWVHGSQTRNSQLYRGSHHKRPWGKHTGEAIGSRQKQWTATFSVRSQRRPSADFQGYGA
jgi:monoamine oxidase